LKEVSSGGLFYCRSTPKAAQDLRGCFSHGKTDDAALLAQGKEDNAAMREIDRKDVSVLK